MDLREEVVHEIRKPPPINWGMPPFTIDAAELPKQRASMTRLLRRIPIEHLNRGIGTSGTLPLIHRLLRDIYGCCVSTPHVCAAWLFQLELLCTELCPSDGTGVDPFVAHTAMINTGDPTAPTKPYTQSTQDLLGPLRCIGHSLFHILPGDRRRVTAVTDRACEVVDAAMKRVLAYRSGLASALANALATPLHIPALQTLIADWILPAPS